MNGRAVSTGEEGERGETTRQSCLVIAVLPATAKDRHFPTRHCNTYAMPPTSFRKGSLRKDVKTRWPKTMMARGWWCLLIIQAF